MLIQIQRDLPEPNSDSVIGELSVDGEPFCVTQEPLERADRLFVPGESALPTGLYNLSITYCKRFRRELPLLAAAPALMERRASHLRMGMRIHPGLRVHESHGEIVVGRRRVHRTVVETSQAFDALLEAIEDAIRHEEAVEVEIT